MSQDHGYNQDRDAQGSENPEEPVSFVDKRRVDPETGQVRSQGSGPESAEPFEDLGEEEIVDAEVVDDASDAQNTQDPLCLVRQRVVDRLRESRMVVRRVVVDEQNFIVDVRHHLRYRVETNRRAFVEIVAVTVISAVQDNR